MRKTALMFELPNFLSSDEFIAQLNAILPIQVVTQHPVTATFYDSFDWRLYHAGMFCAFEQSEGYSRLSLQNLTHPQELMAIDIPSVPRFAHEFTHSDFQEQLAVLLEMRALLPVYTLPYQYTQLNIRNSDQKTLLRLSVAAFPKLPGRVTVQLLKGYDKTVLPIIDLLRVDLGLSPVKYPLLVAALKTQGKAPGTYSSKLNIQLVPDMPAEVACKYIYSHLLKVIQLNQQGCIEQIDTEFLHDLRVAVRRTRAGLSQIKQVLPTETCHYFAEFFSWLSHITGPIRDLDVYLLNFQRFKKSLPISIREDLNPLRAHLLAKQQVAYHELAGHLQSPRYVNTLAQWQAYLYAPASKNAQEHFAKMPIKQLADQRIWKVYKRLLKQGQGIQKDSPPEMLHSLRKTAKKLRYLMEFFQQLYPEMDIDNLLQYLKGLQEVLGDFQDHEVQEQTLKQVNFELKDQGAPIATFLAIGVLIHILNQRKQKARQTFSKRFEQFSRSRNRQLFKDLFAPHHKIRDLDFI